MIEYVYTKEQLEAMLDKCTVIGCAESALLKSHIQLWNEHEALQIKARILAST